ncbi:S8 family serine peptidase [Sphingomonas psychrotolerans]|uniref:S8 family serine peptidase n=1 Tax=Sphingomonas psychrotolerans TaxID=1327635 RepID=A0ABU3N517_9SPHN|nr:S8 family serine peptidase [Sphingomonas psychrotolerans]MDT8759628.1 S8 family serine peptidase [Sphingomonas psychrotolerans]
MNRRPWLLVAALSIAPSQASAQLVQVPSLPGPVGGVVRDLGASLPRDSLVQQIDGIARGLARERLQRLEAIARLHPDAIELDRDGNPVRAREIVVEDPDGALLTRASAAGFALLEHVTIEGLEIGYARFRVPAGASVRAALKRMRAIAGGRDVSADPLHFASGHVGAGAAGSVAPQPAAPGPLAIGIIDGGVDPRAVPGPLVQQAFAAGGPNPNAHATAIASLIQGAPSIRGAAPQARLVVADVYGRDPAGGSATAVARAIGWMVRQRVPVVAVSLVGPANPLLARVVAAARARGTVIVAAVGNDGPAAPPAYPASYPEALAVTGVDGRNRALIEAGRARHLDYAAPGADMLAAGLAGRPMAVRGTSFAVPFAAARLARFYTAPDSAALAGGLRMLDREAQDLGRRGADPAYGRGLVCSDCRTPNK